VVNARTDSDLETAFASFSQQRVGAVLVGTSTLYNRRMEQLAALAARGEAERLGGFEIDGQLDFCGLLDRKISRFLDFENAPGMDASSAVRIAEAAAIANQAASQDELTV
jgi:hypothetical protein